MATAAAALATAELPCALSAAAFSSALDAGSSLPLTFLSHWRQKEAEQLARRAIIDATRGRQQQRHREVATLLRSDGAGPADGIDVALLASLATVRLAGGAAPAGGEMRGGVGGGLGQPPLQQASELDELTWLASHPPESEPGDAAGCGGDAGGGAALWLPHARQQHAAHAAAGADLAGEGAGSGPGAPNGQGPVQLRVGGELLSVRPMWIAVHQPEEGGPARLFESVTPLRPDLVDRLSADITPFCSVAGMAFGAADEAAGGWRNFFVGLVGSVAADEADILWPNQVLHRDRVLFNLRNGWDVAKFLADPQPEDVQAHRDNLLRLAAERGYRRGWAWRMLRLRWGEAALRRFGVEV